MSAVRLLEPSNAALQRACECAPFVPEELALDEAGGHRAAVQLDHGAVPRGLRVWMALARAPSVRSRP